MGLFASAGFLRVINSHCSMHERITSALAVAAVHDIVILFRLEPHVHKYRVDHDFLGGKPIPGTALIAR